MHRLTKFQVWLGPGLHPQPRHPTPIPTALQRSLWPLRVPMWCARSFSLSNISLLSSLGPGSLVSKRHMLRYASRGLSSSTAFAASSRSTMHRLPTVSAIVQIPKASPRILATSENSSIGVRDKGGSLAQSNQISEFSISDCRAHGLGSAQSRCPGGGSYHRRRSCPLLRSPSS